MCNRFAQRRLVEVVHTEMLRITKKNSSDNSSSKSHKESPGPPDALFAAEETAPPGGTLNENKLTMTMNAQLKANRAYLPCARGVRNLFGDEEDASLQLVDIISGPFAERLPVADMPIGRIRERFCHRLDIEPRSIAIVDGNDASDETVVRGGQVLAFIHRAGEKG